MSAVMRCSAALSRARQQPCLASELGAVVVDVVLLDQPVLDREHVDALEVDAGAGRLDSLERRARRRCRPSASARRRARRLRRGRGSRKSSRGSLPRCRRRTRAGPPGAWKSPIGVIRSSPPLAQNLIAPVEVARIERVQVGPHDLLGRVVLPLEALRGSLGSAFVSGLACFSVSFGHGLLRSFVAASRPSLVSPASDCGQDQVADPEHDEERQRALVVAETEDERRGDKHDADHVVDHDV